MNLSNVFLLNTIVALAYAIGLVLLPDTMNGLYGIQTGEGARLMSQYFGVTLLAVGLISWFGRSMKDVEARSAVALAIFVSDVVGLIISIMGTVSGAMNSMGWSAVVIYVVLGAGFGYFRFVKPEAT